MSGLNDPDADTDHDHAISLRELAAYLTQRVDAWARQHRALRQRPMLVGSTDSFLLASLNRRQPLAPARTEKPEKAADKQAPTDQPGPSEKTSKDADKGKADDKNQVEKKRKEEPPKEEPATPTRVYPVWLARGWAPRDHWISGPQIAAAPRLFRQLEAQLLRVEQDYRLGKDSKSLETSLDGSIMLSRQ